jgi:hypothetical protein
LVVVLLALGCGGQPSAGPAADKPGEAPGGKPTAEALASEWTFYPGKDAKVQSWGSSTEKSGETLVLISGRLRDPGKAKEWLAKASKFYAEKCGSDKDPVKIAIDTGKHTLGINGEDKAKGRYLISEPGLMSMPIAEIPPRPTTLVFAHNSGDATVSVSVWQQGDDVLMIAVTAAVR